VTREIAERLRGVSKVLEARKRSAEEVATGPAAESLAGRLSDVLETVTYRGAVLDYVLRLPDGQSITASMTRRMELTTGFDVSIGIDARSVILLDD
jgi:hypothetical protein